MNASRLVFNKLFDRLRELGFEVSQNAQISDEVYSAKLMRDASVFDIKGIAMGNKGIIHVMNKGDLLSLDFDIKEMIHDEKIDCTKMADLLSKLQHKISNAFVQV